MDYLPIFLNLKGKTCLVVGCTETTVTKIDLLLNANATVKLVCDTQLNATLTTLVNSQRITHFKSQFSEQHLDGCSLAFGTSTELENNALAMAAQKLGIPVNINNPSDLSTFVLPSIVDRSPIMVAISSGGASPVLSRLLRTKLESLIPASYGKLALLAARFKSEVKHKFTNIEARRSFWEKVFSSPISEMIFSGRERQAYETFEEMLASNLPTEYKGEVYLVGAGPGNPDLLTFRALRLMQQADVVVYDRLVSQPILEMCRRDAERIYVGKERDNHAVPQDQINMLLAELAKQGKRVVRLKGGDPFIFGRGGEEIETLREYNVPFQVVPAITAAAGVASYAGIPLTHRDYAQALVLVTGHLKDNSMDLDWEMLCRPNQTIVIYMGLKGIVTLCSEMISHGMPAAMPAAIVQQGTTQNQRVVIGTLETLPQLASQAELKPPTLIIVGEVVKLHEKLNWFEPSINS